MARRPVNFAEEIERAAGDEPVLAISIAPLCDFGADARHAPGNARAGEILTWRQARPLLAYDHDRGFGTQECHDILAWTATRVLWVDEYDGSTRVRSQPRHPVACPAEHLAWTREAGGMRVALAARSADGDFEVVRVDAFAARGQAEQVTVLSRHATFGQALAAQRDALEQFGTPEDSIGDWAAPAPEAAP